MNDLIPLEENTELVPRSETEIAMARVQQEVQASIAIAKRFPRNRNDCRDAIVANCSRLSFCVDPKDGTYRAIYKYTRGKQVVGESIFLAQEMALVWGNMTYGFRVLEQTRMESVVEAFAWDMETNVKATRVFTVRHVIGKTNPQTKQVEDHLLTDARSIYETVANQAQRRVRACILSLIPRDIRDEAMSKIQETLSGDKTPLPEKIKRCIEEFSKLNITQNMLEKHIGRPMKQASEWDIISLRAAYSAIKHGIHEASEYFPDAAPVEGDLGARMGAKKPAKAPAKKPAEPSPAPGAGPSEEMKKTLRMLKAVLAEAKGADELEAIEKAYTAKAQDPDDFDLIMGVIEEERDKRGLN